MTVEMECMEPPEMIECQVQSSEKSIIFVKNKVRGEQITVTTQTHDKVLNSISMIQMDMISKKMQLKAE